MKVIPGTNSFLFFSFIWFDNGNSFIIMTTQERREKKVAVLLLYRKMEAELVYRKESYWVRQEDNELKKAYTPMTINPFLKKEI